MPDNALGQHRAQASVPGAGRRHDQCFGEIAALHHLLFELSVWPHVRSHDHRHETRLPSLFDEPRYLDTGQAKAVGRLLVGQPELKMKSGYALPAGLERSLKLIVVRTTGRVLPFCRYEPSCLRHPLHPSRTVPLLPVGAR